MCTDKSTAILFFSRTPQQEVQKKELSFKGSKAVFKLLLHDNLKKARKAGLPLYHCQGASQTGDTFGERLVNAIESVFAKGHKRLIVVGSDVPGLKRNTFLVAASRLQENQLVLGPSLDGGVYLIGLSADQYEREQFLALQWETNKLQGCWLEYAQENKLNCSWLEPLADIDNTAEFWSFFRKLKEGNIFRRIRHFLQIGIRLETHFFYTFSYTAHHLDASHFRRGPPIRKHFCFNSFCSNQIILSFCY